MSHNVIASLFMCGRRSRSNHHILLYGFNVFVYLLLHTDARAYKSNNFMEIYWLFHFVTINIYFNRAESGTNEWIVARNVSGSKREEVSVSQFSRKQKLFEFLVFTLYIVWTLCTITIHKSSIHFRSGYPTFSIIYFIYYLDGVENYIILVWNASLSLSLSLFHR